MSTYTWEFGAAGSGLHFTVVYDTSTNEFKVTSQEGSFDLNALWFSDANGTSDGYTLVKSDNSLNMNGSTTVWDDGTSTSEKIVWDDYLKLSSTGLGSEGTEKTTFITAGETATFDAGDFDPTVFTTLGVRATSVNGGDSIKWADTEAEFSTGDTTPPTLTVDIVDESLYDGDNSSVVNFEFSEDVTGLEEADVVVAGGTLSGFTQVDGNSWTATFTADDGVETTGSVSVAAASYTDVAGNDGGAGTDDVTIDTLNPTVVVDIVDASLNDTDNSSLVTFEFSEDVTGFDVGDLTPVNGTLSGFTGSGSSYTAIFTADDAIEDTGSVSVGSGYTDLAGNTGGTGSDDVTIDTKNPTVSSVVASDLLITDADTPGAGTFTVTVDFSEAMKTDGSADPTLTFDPAVASTLSLVSGGWFDADTFIATYNVADGNVDHDSVTIDVEDAEDAVGNDQDDYTPENEFAIDTENPIANGETIHINNDPVGLPEWLLLLNDTNDAVDVTNVGGSSGATSVVHTAGVGSNGFVTFDDNATLGGSFTYQVVDSVGNLSATATATIVRYSGGTINTGSTGSDTVFGSAGNDGLQGTTGDDVYVFRSSGDQNDTITETGGNDKIIIGTNGVALTTLNFIHLTSGANDGDLQISYDGGSITVTDHFSVGGASVEQIVFLGGGSYLGYTLSATGYLLDTNLTGGTDADVIAGTNSADASIAGGDGNDLLFGNNQADGLNGAGGNDLLIGGTQSDAMQGGTGSDYFQGGDGADVLYANSILTPSDTDTDRFIYRTLSEGGDTINGFSTDEPAPGDGPGGDILTLADVLDLAGNTWVDGTDVETAVDDGYLSFTDSNGAAVGGDVQVNVDIDGAAAGFSPTLIATLQGVGFTDATGALNLMSDNIKLD